MAAGCNSRQAPRSEEHTSELQSQFHLVCRHLLEKKNQGRQIGRALGAEYRVGRAFHLRAQPRPPRRPSDPRPRVGLDRRSYYFFFNDTATTEIYTLSLHDALPI